MNLDLLLNKNVDISDDQIKELKIKVRQLEKRAKERNKPKTITISGSDHIKIKNYCSSLNLNIGEWASKILLKEIDNKSCIIEPISIDKEKEMLMEKYSLPKQNFIKSNKLIFRNSFKFIGYSAIDFKPIYNYLGEELPSDLVESDIKFEKCRPEIITNVVNEELEWTF